MEGKLCNIHIHMINGDVLTVWSVDADSFRKAYTNYCLYPDKFINKALQHASHGASNDAYFRWENVCWIEAIPRN